MSISSFVCFLRKQRYHVTNVGIEKLKLSQHNIIIIIYSIYRALIPYGPKALYIIKNNDKILNLQNYIVIL